MNVLMPSVRFGSIEDAITDAYARWYLDPRLSTGRKLFVSTTLDTTAGLTVRTMRADSAAVRFVATPTLTGKSMLARKRRRR